ncbi:thiamine phosphate synthase [Paracidobacterium acidisoli]|uniref:Thiamine phosphate synthase n=1 Tax=Paracidobacterium acidisoli TaxID=2303751 RepID=A0A372IME6_9BACT|nr:thiamine phosphate synthase [Paracidobacterium acidisoli]MBT9331773.1 thiamine phosphate synthase [Paracidobacterium acidisoli]
MLLCAITNRKLLGDDESSRRAALVHRTQIWARDGIPFILIREKDLPLPDLQSLASEIAAVVHAEGGKTRLLLSAPPQLALAANADGIHLSSGIGLPGITAAEQAYRRAGREPLVSVSCHNPDDIRQARGASLLLFAPVFEKVTETRTLPGQGLVPLRQACQAAGDIPVLALGGITASNARVCVDAGAAGIAAIRLFLTGAWHALR